MLSINLLSLEPIIYTFSAVISGSFGVFAKCIFQLFVNRVNLNIVLAVIWPNQNTVILPRVKLLAGI